MVQSELNGRSKVLLFPFFLTRFVAVYFVLLIIPFPLNCIRYLSFITRPYYHTFKAFVLWSGHHILHLTTLYIPPNNGSGDTLFNYVLVLVVAVIALLLTLVWLIVIRNSKKDSLLLTWITVYIQFYFALMMMRYGLEKVIKAQFPFPYTSLTETYGESSPMRLMWNFMGYSTAYNVIIGVAEVAAGFLVLFKKTILTGALLSIGILINVVVLNICYDVPVKLFATQFLLMAVFIAAPDAKRLMRFFLTNKAVSARPVAPLFRNQRTMRLWLTAKFLVAAVVLHYLFFHVVWLKYTNWGDAAFKQTPLFGIYRVEMFVKNSDSSSSQLPDAMQWKELSIIYKKKAIIRLMNDSIRECRLVTDTIHQKIEMGEKGNSTDKAIFSYTRSSPSQLLLTGRWRNDAVSIVLQKQDLNQYLLLNRGFHWINEYPYNK